MLRFLAAATLAATFIVSACGAATSPSASPSTPAVPTPAPSESAPPSPTAAPSEAPPSETPSDQPSGAPNTPTAQEQYLIDGALRDVEDCQPIRVNLPTGAIAGVECTSDDPDVARIGFYLFEDDETMLDAYFARMDEEGIVRESGGCVQSEGEGEGAYVPGEGESRVTEPAASSMTRGTPTTAPRSQAPTCTSGSSGARLTWLPCPTSPGAAIRTRRAIRPCGRNPRLIGA